MKLEGVLEYADLMGRKPVALEALQTDSTSFSGRQETQDKVHDLNTSFSRLHVIIAQSPSSKDYELIKLQHPNDFKVLQF